MSIEMKNPETLVGMINAAWNNVEQIGLALSIGDVAHAKKAKAEAARLLSLAMEQTEEDSEVKPPQLNQAELYEGLRHLVDRIEACGASTELTAAVTLASDLGQAVGNRWNEASEFAADRVREVGHLKNVNLVVRRYADAACIKRDELKHEIMESTADDAKVIGVAATDLLAWSDAAGRIRRENRELSQPPSADNT